MATDLALKSWEILVQGWSGTNAHIIQPQSDNLCRARTLSALAHGFRDRRCRAGASEAELKPVAVILRTISPVDCMRDSVLTTSVEHP